MKVKKIEKIYQWPGNYGGVVRFESRYPLKESIERLQKSSVRRFSLSGALTTLAESQIVGRVSEKCVVLVRVLPVLSLLNPGNRITFIGKFIELSDGKVVLEGYFTVNLAVKILFWILLLLGIVIEPLVILTLFSPDRSLNQALFVIFFIPVLILVKLFSTSSMSFLGEDIKWISDKIEQYLN